LPEDFDILSAEIDIFVYKTKLDTLHNNNDLIFIRKLDFFKFKKYNGGNFALICANEPYKFCHSCLFAQHGDFGSLEVFSEPQGDLD